MATKLTPAQARVMKWLGKGWEAQPGAGASLIVNGQRICNTDTMMALYRTGLVTVDEKRCWRATESGKKISREVSDQVSGQ